MQQTEVTNLALDCDLPHKAFAMARIHQIMAKSDQLDGNDAAQRAGGDKVGELSSSGLPLYAVTRVTPHRTSSHIVTYSHIPSPSLTFPDMP